MTKNVLIISSSPRKGGNSDTLCDRFLDGAVEAGHRAEKIRLSEKNINYCTGCGACVRTGACVQEDDMAELLERMLAADVIVLGTPVYFYTMCAQLKTFIDRVCPVYTRLKGKEFYLLLTAADTSAAAMEPTVAGFRAFLSCLPEARERGVVYGVGAWNVGDIKKSPAMAQAHEMGRNA